MQANAGSAKQSLQQSLPIGVEVFGAMKPDYATILSKEALEFVARLAGKYTGRCGRRSGGLPVQGLAWVVQRGRGQRGDVGLVRFNKENSVWECGV